MTDNARPGANGALDATSKALLTRLQSHIPLVERPFRAVAQELGISEAEVIERTRALSEARLIRQISAIFDGRSLGYDSCLVAAQYAPERLERAARIVSSHPGVSHNYRRDHDFNLWYTIAVPPGQSLDDEIATLHRLSGAESTRLLPSVRLFKLGVKLDLHDGPSDAQIDDSANSARPAHPATAAPLTDRDIRAVRAFQDPFPVTERPFERAAEVHGFASTHALLEAARDLHERHVMRRFSAVLRHREAGFQANGMVVWVAEPEECAAAGAKMARFAKVSHCYQRPTYADWPYALFSMIHGRTADDVQECIDAIQEATGLREYRVLYSSVEYKKARVRYFTEEWDRWRRDVARWEPVSSPGAHNAEAGAAAAYRASAGAGLSQRRIDRMRLWGHLQSLQVCMWDIASLHRKDFDAVREAAKLHAGTGMLLTSCQRLEAYSLQGCNCGAGARKYGLDALLHLAEVAAGLHSVVLGEEQIAGQVRNALASGPAGVRELGDIALAAAREVRREASFDGHAGHLLDRGLSVAGIEPEGHALVIGTGHMGRLIARRARDLGFGQVIVAGRREPESDWLEEVGGRFVALDRMPEMDPIDVAVGCLGSEAAELNAARHLPRVNKLVLDLGTPRNFVNGSSAPLLAIEDLLSNSNGTAHRRERQESLRNQLREKLERRLQMAAADSQSTVGALRLEVEKLRQSEMERIERLHPELPTELMEIITRSLVNRLFHGVSEGLKRIDDPDFHEQMLELFMHRPESRATAAVSA